MRSTKIVATIGPASQEDQTIFELLQAGVNIARLNFSHGTYEGHRQVYTRLRQAAQKLGRSVSILQDLQGPKIRVGEIKLGSVEIHAGDQLVLTTQKILGDQQIIPVDFPQLLESVQPGNRILLDDGNLELLVEKLNGDKLITTVILGGLLKSHKGINLPGAQFNIPSFTAKDRQDLEFGLELGVDYIAVSFVQRPEDILHVRQRIEQSELHRYVPIIAKLERPQALDNLEEIIQVSDGVMVARGDLGVEMSPEVVPIVQKRIIEAANQHCKLVITATQMLESMIHNPRPTRAEASDVANAIFDGTDAVMLSAETASGQYPIESVKMMNAIIVQAEKHITSWGRWQGNMLSIHEGDDTYHITQAVHELATDRNVAAISVFTRSGRTALFMSKTRPQHPVLAFTPEQNTFNRMNLLWGVVPYLVPQVESLEEMVKVVDQTLLQVDWIYPGQQVILICGFPIPSIRPTNLALLHKVGESVR